MTAVEFIQKFGWEHAKDVCNGWITNYQNIDLNNLKRYVDAYESVQSYGGVEKAKEMKINGIPLDFIMNTGRLKQAIALVEEVVTK